jgi:hypothetical protein
MRQGSLAGERATLGWSADGGDIEYHRAKNAARLRRAQHVAGRPRAPTPSDRGVGPGQQIAHKCTARRVRTLQRSGAQQSSCLRPERQGPDVDEVEGERWQRKGREVTADRRARSRTGRESLGRYAGANAGESKDSAGALGEMVVDLDEGSGGSPRESNRSKRRDRPVDIATRQTLASEDGH